MPLDLTPLRNAAVAITVAVAVLAIGTDVAGAVTPVRPADPGQSAPDDSPVAEPTPDESGGEDGPGVGLPPPPGSEIGEEADEATDSDEAPAPASPFDVLLDLEADGRHVTAHVELIQLAALVDDVDQAQAVTLGIVWGDGETVAYDLRSTTARSFSPVHRYDIDENQVFTVHAYVTDDQGRHNANFERITLEALYDVRMTAVQFQPWWSDCDSWPNGKGDFEFGYDFAWGGYLASDDLRFDLDDGEVEVISTAGVTGRAVTTSDYPTVDARWLEHDFGLELPAQGVDLALRPDPDDPVRWETVYSQWSSCRARIVYRVTTSPHV